MDNKDRVKLMSRALRDLDNIYTYIARNLLEPGTAEKLIDTLEEEILSLESMPHRCVERKVGAYAGKGYRQLFVKNYTVVFRIDEEHRTVIVVTVRYSRHLHGIIKNSPSGLLFALSDDRKNRARSQGGVTGRGSRGG